ncbi:hypothetical protein, partial [Serratia ureilytica]|uniref:hypothetical protein n=1 Tax=Serratia ureilytica TaxID=300181 RepID=UPI00313EE64E
PLLHYPTSLYSAKISVEKPNWTVVVVIKQIRQADQFSSDLLLAVIGGQHPSPVISELCIPE